MGFIIARMRLKQRCACAVYFISQNFAPTEGLEQRSFHAIVNALMYDSLGFSWKSTPITHCYFILWRDGSARGRRRHKLSWNPSCYWSADRIGLCDFLYPELDEALYLYIIFIFIFIIYYIYILYVIVALLSFIRHFSSHSSDWLRFTTRYVFLFICFWCISRKFVTARFTNSCIVNICKKMTNWAIFAHFVKLPV